MKLNIEELIGKSNEAAMLALDYSLHEGFDRERMKAFARLIVERCAAVADSSGHHWSGPTAHALFDCATEIRNLLGDE